MLLKPNPNLFLFKLSSKHRSNLSNRVTISFSPSHNNHNSHSFDAVKHGFVSSVTVLAICKRIVGFGVMMVVVVIVTRLGVAIVDSRVAQLHALAPHLLANHESNCQQN